MVIALTPTPPLPILKAFGGKYTTKFDTAVYLGAPMDQDFREALAESVGGPEATATLTS